MIGRADDGQGVPGSADDATLPPLEAVRGARSITELKRVCRKAERDPFWICNIFWRPLSIYVTWLCLRAGVTANQVTAISAIFALGSSLVLLVPDTVSYVASAVGLQVYLLLDLVDGEVARYRTTIGGVGGDASGVYFDRLIHYLQGPSQFYCLGAGLMLHDGSAAWPLLGVVAALCRSWFPRLVATDVAVTTAAARHDRRTRYLIDRIGRSGALAMGEDARPLALRIPRTRIEWLRSAKQVIYYPGDFFIFGAAVALDALAAPPGAFPYVTAYLAGYAALLVVHSVLGLRAYVAALASPRAPDPRAGRSRNRGHDRA